MENNKNRPWRLCRTIPLHGTAKGGIACYIPQIVPNLRWVEGGTWKQSVGSRVSQIGLDVFPECSKREIVKLLGIVDRGVKFPPYRNQVSDDLFFAIRHGEVLAIDNYRSCHTTLNFSELKSD